MILFNIEIFVNFDIIIFMEGVAIISSINSEILKAVKSHFDSYGCNECEIKDFFRKRGFTNKQESALNIIKKILTSHSKEDIHTFMELLSKLEPGVQSIQYWIRDHVVHAVLCYILGIYINEKFLKDTKEVCQIDPFQWKLACLLHDIGYPVEICNNLFNRFSTDLNSVLVNTEDSHRACFHVSISGIDRLTDGKNSFELIQDCLDRWELDLHAHDLYNQMINTQEMNHGIISGLTVLKMIDSLYYKNIDMNPSSNTTNNSSWEWSDFHNYIVPACAAIFIHGLDTEQFRSLIDYEKAPLAFLLRVSDSLQEWQRPKGNDQSYHSPADFSITIINNKLTFTIKNNDVNIINKVKKEVCDSISRSDGVRNKIEIE